MKKDGNAHDKSQKRKAAELIYEGLAETKEEYKLEATSLHDTMKNSSRTKHRWTWAKIAVSDSGICHWRMARFLRGCLGKQRKRELHCTL